MSKAWYPVINYSTCLECGTCVIKCTHDVYEKGVNKPKVIYPEGCVEGCTGCQNFVQVILFNMLDKELKNQI